MSEKNVKKEPDPEGRAGEKRDQRPRLLLRLGVIVLAVVIGLVAWILSGDDDSPSSQAPPVEAQVLTTEELESIAAEADQPIFWAGERQGTDLELVPLQAGGYQLRYLPADEDGGGGDEVLTIGSYPVADAAAAVAGFGARPDGIVRESSEGVEVASSRARPTSVYFADPEGSVQVEVYDPSPERAMSLALSGAVEAVR